MPFIFIIIIYVYRPRQLLACLCRPQAQLMCQLMPGAPGGGLATLFTREDAAFFAAVAAEAEPTSAGVTNVWVGFADFMSPGALVGRGGEWAGRCGRGGAGRSITGLRSFMCTQRACRTFRLGLSQFMSRALPRSSCRLALLDCDERGAARGSAGPGGWLDTGRRQPHHQKYTIRRHGDEGGGDVRLSGPQWRRPHPPRRVQLGILLPLHGARCVLMSCM